MSFCSNCGNQLQEGQNFCGACGTVRYEAAPQQSVQPQYSAPTQYQQPLISGNGGHMKKKANVGIFAIIYGVVLIFISIFGYSYVSSSYSISRSMKDMLAVLMPISIIGMLLWIASQIYLYMANSAASKTSINVDAYAIAGSGLTSKTSLKSFNLSHSDVIKVDVVQKPSSIILHTPYANYTCHVENPEAIRHAIMGNRGAY